MEKKSYQQKNKDVLTIHDSIWLPADSLIEQNFASGVYLRAVKELFLDNDPIKELVKVNGLLWDDLPSDLIKFFEKNHMSLKDLELNSSKLF